jgi:hypothetical protein
MSHPELRSLGGEIIGNITELTGQGKQGSFAFDALPELFDKMDGQLR